MNGDSFTPDERNLIERLSNAPQADLTPDTFEAIRARMFEAMDAPPVTPTLPHPRPPINMVVAAGVVAVVVIVIVIVIALISTPRPEEINVPTVTVMATQTPITPTVTSTVTPIPVEAIVTAEVTADVTPVTPTPTATLVVSPSFTPTVTLESVIVIQGPVQSIDGNQVIFYGLTVYFNPDDVLLDVIQVGDVIRVEGMYETDTRVILVVRAEYVMMPTNPEVNVNPDTGEAWRDNGNCDHPPPTWAPANGWRRRCQGQNGGNPSAGGGNNNNNNNDSSGSGSVSGS